MGGKVKYKSSKPKKAPAQRKPNLAARIAHTTVVAPPVVAATLPSSSTHGPLLGKTSIIWIAVLSTIVVVGLIVVLWLLFRCTCRKGKLRRTASGHHHHPSLEITDGRNEFEAWNRSVTGRINTYQSEHELTPLAKAAVKPAGDPHPGDPVIIDEAPLTPIEEPRVERRYYGGVGSVFKRISQIGKAY